MEVGQFRLMRQNGYPPDAWPEAHLKLIPLGQRSLRRIFFSSGYPLRRFHLISVRGVGGERGGWGRILSAAVGTPELREAGRERYLGRETLGMGPRDGHPVVMSKHSTPVTLVHT